MVSKRLSTRGRANAASQQVESPQSGDHAADAFRFDILRATTPEVELFRRAYPHAPWRDEPVSTLKIYLLELKISVMQKRGNPHAGLPEVTAEEIQEFCLQYRSMPALKWARDAQLQDDLVRPTIQAMKILGLSLAKLWRRRKSTGRAQSASGTRSAKPAGSARLPGTTQSDDDGHVPEYLLDEFMEILEVRGEQEALRWLRESKAKAAGESQGSGQSRRKRSSAGLRDQVFSLDDMFNPGDDDVQNSAVAFGNLRSGDIVIDDDPAAFGITEIRNARGQVVFDSRRRVSNNNNSTPALNRMVDIHIDDDLVGAAEASAPAEKFIRLMNSGPTQSPRKKRAKK